MGKDVDVEAATVASIETSASATDSLTLTSGPGKTKRQKRTLRNRLLFAARSILFLWITSPNVAINTAGRAVGPFPSWDEVRNAQKTLEDFVDLVARHGTLSLEEAYSVCRDNLAKATRNLNFKTGEERDVNKAMIDFVSSDQEDFKADVTTLYRVVESREHSIPFTNASNCSATDHEQVQARIGGNNDSVLSQTSGITSNFLNDVESRVRLLVDYAAERSNYDIEYLANKTGLALLELDGFGSFGGLDTLNVSDILEDLRLDLVSSLFCDVSSGKSCHFHALTSAVEEVIDEANTLVVHLTRQLAEYRQAILEMSEHIDELSGLVLNIYSGLRVAKETFPNLASFFGDGLDIDVIPSLPRGISFAPSSLNFIPDFTDFSLDLQLQTFEANVLASFDSLFRDARIAVQFRLNASLHTFTSNLTGILGLDDYDPPQYQGSSSSVRNPEQEIAQYNELSEIFKDDLYESLNAIPTSSSPISDSVSIDIPGLNITNVRSDVAQASVNLTPFGNLSFNFPRAWSILVAIFMWRAYLIRTLNVYNSFKKVWRYWENTSIPLPVVDDTDVVVRQERKEKPSKSLFYKLSAIALSDRVGSILRWTALSLGVGLAALVYRQYFVHYHNRCVSSLQGTDISHSHAVPYYVNKGTGQTSQTYAHMFTDFQLERNNVCSSHYLDSAKLHQEHLIEAYLLDVRTNQTESEVSRLERCVDLGSAGIVTDVFKPPQAVNISNSSFPCDELPQCDLTYLDGKQFISDSTNESMCYGDWHLQSSIWLTAVATVCSFLIWLARVNMEKGSKHALWRHLREETAPNLLTSFEKYTGGEHSMLITPEGNICDVLPIPKPGVKKANRAILLFELRGLLHSFIGLSLAALNVATLQLVQRERYSLHPSWWSGES